MADWQKLLKDIILADGVIDAEEVGYLKEEILADGVVDREEIDFLVALRNAAKKTSPEFDKFFFEALELNILEDEIIDEDEVKRLREILYADGIIDDNEKESLRRLRMGAKQTCTGFLALYEECLGKPEVVS